MAEWKFLMCFSLLAAFLGASVFLQSKDGNGDFLLLIGKEGESRYSDQEFIQARDGDLRICYPSNLYDSAIACRPWKELRKPNEYDRLPEKVAPAEEEIYDPWSETEKSKATP